MTQNPNPAAARAPGAGDGPDLLFVIRHYRWLLIIGTLLGLMVGTGLYYTLKTIAPKYRAESIFLARGKDLSVLNQDRANGTSPEEVSQFIRTQVVLLRTPEFLEDVFKIQYILDSQWYKHQKSPEAARLALLEALDAQPTPGTNLFKVSLTLAERTEVDDILNKISEAYTESLKAQTNRQVQADLTAFRGAFNAASDRLNIANNTANEYRSNRDIPGMMNSQTIALTALGQLDARLTELVLDRGNLQKAVDALRKEQADPAYKLPLQLQALVSGNEKVRSLEDMKMSLDREREVQEKLLGKDHPIVRGIVQRIEIVVKQLGDVRKVQEDLVKMSQMQNVESALSATEARIVDIKKKHDEKQAEVRRLDNDLVGYRALEDAVRAARQAYDQAQAQLNTQEGILNTLQPRVESRQKAVEPSPDQIASPTMTAFLPTGTIAGLVVAFAVAYLLELTNTRIRTPRDITRTLQLPLLGFVPDQEDDDLLQGDLATSIRTSPISMTAESFRQIRGRLSAQADGSPVRTLLISSVAPGGGATTIASNLATGMALNGRRVLLVDANFYRPGLASIYPNVPAVGLSDLLSNISLADSAVAPTAELPNLFVMGPGSKQASGTAELLDSSACRDVISRLKDRFDVIIFDGAPLSLVSDSVALAAKVDGVIAVVRAGRETRGTVARVREQLRQVKANFLGIVLNAAQTQSSGYFKENYRSFYSYANTPATTNGHTAAGRQAAKV